MWSCKGDGLEGIWGELESGNGVYMILIYIHVWNSLEKKRDILENLPRSNVTGMDVYILWLLQILVLLNCLILSVKFKRHYFSIAEAF